MTAYRCVRTYFFKENDGNGEITVPVLSGQLFVVWSSSELPGNYMHSYTHYFQAVYKGEIL